MRRIRKNRVSDSGPRPTMSVMTQQQPMYEPPQEMQYAQPSAPTNDTTDLSMQQQLQPDHTQQHVQEYYAPQNMNYMGAPPLAQPPIPQQSQPTQVLYERARLAATSKASPNARRAGLPSQRRPWTTEEENALMAGLDRVKGPHWSQILAMFGPGGTVSEALKDRNQVQLKDKARNLKLFFLKSGIEVPYYLRFVTGELKTRAPGQAAKNAAKKQVEASQEEDAAHVAAVTALGNAHRQGSMDQQHQQVVQQVVPQNFQAINHQQPQAPMAMMQQGQQQDQGTSMDMDMQQQDSANVLLAVEQELRVAVSGMSGGHDHGIQQDVGVGGHEVSAERGT